MENIVLLGATGSIGTSTLDVIAQHPDRFAVYGVSAGSNTKALAAIAARTHAKVAVIADTALLDQLASDIRAAGLVPGKDIEVSAGSESLVALARDPKADTIVQATVGAAGLAASFAAARCGKRLLLANKESVVCGGDLFMRTVRENGAVLLPVDSEHNAIFQCLAAGNDQDRKAAHLWLTCSGGPFRAKKDLDLSTVTPEMALSHPTWSMGSKISIDSATLMNKGLEVIEAHHLFDIDCENIHVAVHPQSVVHSMVEFTDGAVIAQMGAADMRLPIAHCLGWPERINGGVKHLDFTAMQNLTFEAPDLVRFPQLQYAYDAIKTGGIACIVLNAANEIAVGAFLRKEIGFTDIAGACRAMLDTVSGPAPQTEEDIILADAQVRRLTAEWCASHAM